LLLILLLIKLIFSPFAYWGHIIQTKKNALQPYLASIASKYKDEAIKRQIEENALYKKAEIGSLKSLLVGLYSIVQALLFISIIFFSRNAIGLRGASFLWIKDLASVDKTIQWDFFSIPLLGNHVSVLAIVVAILFSYGRSSPFANFNMLTEKEKKIMKYVLPAISFFIFNTLPAAWHCYQIFNFLLDKISKTLLSYLINEKKVASQTIENVKKKVANSTYSRKQARLQRKVIGSKKKDRE